MFFGYEKDTFPLYISEEKYHQTMNLLLISKEGNDHYVLITEEHQQIVFWKDCLYETKIYLRRQVFVPLQYTKIT